MEKTSAQNNWTFYLDKSGKLNSYVLNYAFGD